LLEFGDYGTARAIGSGPGFSAGNWAHRFDNSSYYSMALACSYAYRNQPVGHVNCRSTGAAAVWDYGGGVTSFEYRGVNFSPYPKVGKKEAYMPMFKTQKDQGNRALVADRYGKPGKMGIYYPGDGWFAHKDGYNVLYGDYHCSWYGDPQGRILWYENNVTLPGGYGNPDGSCGSNAMMMNSRYHGGSLGTEMWHLFDVAGGVDTNITQAQMFFLQ
jgi:hypothetical protein